MSLLKACAISLFFLISSVAFASQQAIDPRTDLLFRITAKEGEWKVLRKNGKNWLMIEDYSRDGAQATARGIAIDGSGYIYVAGEARKSDSKKSDTKASAWLVRRSIDEGKTWQTVDEVQGAQPHVIATTYEGEVFAAGSSKSEWVVRYSPNGVHWSVVDRVRSQGRASALTATVETNGTVRIHGITSDRAGKLQLLTRQAHAAFPTAWR